MTNTYAGPAYSTYAGPVYLYSYGRRRHIARTAPDAQGRAYAYCDGSSPFATVRRYAADMRLWYSDDAAANRAVARARQLPVCKSCLKLHATQVELA